MTEITEDSGKFPVNPARLAEGAIRNTVIDMVFRSAAQVWVNRVAHAPIQIRKVDIGVELKPETIGEMVLEFNQSNNFEELVYLAKYMVYTAAARKDWIMQVPIAALDIYRQICEDSRRNDIPELTREMGGNRWCSPVVISVIGGAGTGKTELIEWIAARLPEGSFEIARRMPIAVPGAGEDRLEVQTRGHLEKLSAGEENRAIVETMLHRIAVNSFVDAVTSKSASVILCDGMLQEFRREWGMLHSEGKITDYELMALTEGNRIEGAYIRIKPSILISMGDGEPGSSRQLAHNRVFGDLYTLMTDKRKAFIGAGLVLDPGAPKFLGEAEPESDVGDGKVTEDN